MQTSDPHNSVKLETALSDNLSCRGAQVYTNFSNADSALTYLRLNRHPIVNVLKPLREPSRGLTFAESFIRRAMHDWNK